MTRRVWCLGIAAAAAALACGSAGAEDRAKADWPMLGHDAARTGATSAEVRPPFERKWYRLFADEGLRAGVQPIVAGGKVYVGTLRGVLHAIDAETGKDAWAFRAGGAILHAAAAGEGKVFFGSADGKVYAVNAADGTKAWELATPLAVWNAPAVLDGAVYVGGRDGRLYALSAADGTLRWAAQAGGPLLSSPAVDAARGRIVIGCEDMRIYAFDLADGKCLWRSGKLPGVSLRGYHPVIAPDGSVMVTCQPARTLDDFQPLLLDMVKEIFGDFASWRHTKEQNARLREENLALLAQPDTYGRQMGYLRKRLADSPEHQTFFVLDGATGRQRFIAPIVYAESMNGPGAPPVVTPDGKVIVKYQALLRSRYGHYSPFLNVGYLDTATGDIAPVMDQDRTYGWHDSLLLVHDEQCQLSVAGRVLINAHQDNVNAMDLDTLKGYGEPFCRSIHEPAAGEAAGIWALLLGGRELPPGKEWLARGTAVYGGGSVLDVPVAVAGDSFYYLPTHEINSGCAIIAYRMRPGGKAAAQSPPPADKLTDEQWRQVQKLLWDWDMLGMPRLSHVLKALPAPVPGTPAAPLSDQAADAVAKIPDAELDAFLAEAPQAAPAPQVPSGPSDRLPAELRRCVEELISRDWRPWVFPAGKHPTEAYRFFGEPTETLLALARAYPHLGDPLRQRVRQHVAGLSAPGGPLEGPTGRKTFPPDQGESRCAYDVPEHLQRRAAWDVPGDDAARLYPVWLWAHITGDWRKVEADWPRLRDLAGRGPGKLQADCGNGRLAGLIAAWRMARHAKDDAAAETIRAAARQAMRERIAYELAHPRGGLILLVPTGRSIFARWRNLTPEVGRLLARYAGDIHRHLMDVYVDHHRPTWFLAWNVESMWRNEAPMELPTMSAEVFAARALILREGGGELAARLDVPWCKADLFYMQKLVLAIEAGREE